MPAWIAALWFSVQLVTAPPPDGSAVTAYEAQRRNATVAWQAMNLYESPSNLVAPAPGPHGVRRTVWYSVTQDPTGSLGWRKGGQAERFRYRTASGWLSPWSNWKIDAVVHDTLFIDVCARAWLKPPSDTGPWPSDPRRPDEYYTTPDGKRMELTRSFVGRSQGWQHARRDSINPAMFKVEWYRAAGETLLAGCDRFRGKCALGYGPVVHSERFLCAKCYEGSYWSCSEPTCSELGPCPCGSAVRGGPGPPCQ